MFEHQNTTDCYIIVCLKIIIIIIPEERNNGFRMNIALQQNGYKFIQVYLVVDYSQNIL